MDGWMLVTAFTKVRDAAGNYDSYGFVSTTFAQDEGRPRRKGGPGNWTWSCEKFFG
jgi:hypothetical protein